MIWNLTVDEKVLIVKARKNKKPLHRGDFTGLQHLGGSREGVGDFFRGFAVFK